MHVLTIKLMEGSLEYDPSSQAPKISDGTCPTHLPYHQFCAHNTFHCLLERQQSLGFIRKIPAELSSDMCPSIQR